MLLFFLFFLNMVFYVDLKRLGNCFEEFYLRSKSTL